MGHDDIHIFHDAHFSDSYQLVTLWVVIDGPVCDLDTVFDPECGVSSFLGNPKALDLRVVSPFRTDIRVQFPNERSIGYSYQYYDDQAFNGGSRMFIVHISGELDDTGRSKQGKKGHENGHEILIVNYENPLDRKHRQQQGFLGLSFFLAYQIYNTDHRE